MQGTHELLNKSNPSLASDCWMCMQMANSWPIAVPIQRPVLLPLSNCSHLSPLKVIPQNFDTGHCYFRNSSSLVSLGTAPVINCTQLEEITPNKGCLPPGQV